MTETPETLKLPERRRLAKIVDNWQFQTNKTIEQVSDAREQMASFDLINHVKEFASIEKEFEQLQQRQKEILEDVERQLRGVTLNILDRDSFNGIRLWSNDNPRDILNMFAEVIAKERNKKDIEKVNKTATALRTRIELCDYREQVRKAFEQAGLVDRDGNPTP